jgi:hypothetical protein
MNYIKLLIVFLATFYFGLISSLSAQKSMNTKEYIDSFKQSAMQEMRVHGVPASITLGQGILEIVSFQRNATTILGLSVEKIGMVSFVWQMMMQKMNVLEAMKPLLKAIETIPFF